MPLTYSLFAVAKKSNMWENKDEWTRRGAEDGADDRGDEQLLRRLEKIGLSER